MWGEISPYRKHYHIISLSFFFVVVCLNVFKLSLRLTYSSASTQAVAIETIRRALIQTCDLNNSRNYCQSCWHTQFINTSWPNRIENWTGSKQKKKKKTHQQYFKHPDTARTSDVNTTERTKCSFRSFTLKHTRPYSIHYSCSKLPTGSCTCIDEWTSCKSTNQAWNTAQKHPAVFSLIIRLLIHP